MVRVLVTCAVSAALLCTTAAAQVPAAVETTAASSPATCPDLPPAPDISNASTSQQRMTSANTAYGAWLDQARQILECHRTNYNSVVERMNVVNTDWNTQIDAYCSRGNVRCEPTQREQSAQPMPQ